MNFVFISPHFPQNYWNFCERLHRNGARVLGVGDAPYDSLREELKASLTEYYRVDDLEDYDQVLRAVGYFTHRYGKIDWIESNNEYWMELDARLRTDFNVTTGLKSDEIERYKSKSRMKEYYKKAGVPTARWALVTDKAAALAFIRNTGWPVVIKPDKGVGAGDTWKIENEARLDEFFADRKDIPYILEEFVDGEIVTFDGVSGPDAKPLCAMSHVTPGSIMDMVNEGKPLWYYVDKTISPALQKAGEAVLAAFEARSRFFHLEFFRLLRDQEGLGKKGDIVGLEVNMRPAGGFTVDMMDFAAGMDLYQIWADMVCYGKAEHPCPRPSSYCVCASRRDGVRYLHSHQEIREKYGKVMKLESRLPPVLAECMGDHMYIACLADRSAMERFHQFVHALRPETK